MAPPLDPDDPRAPYLQVAGRLRESIQSGDLGPGSQLPTYNELAEAWGVAVNTAKSAVSLLKDEGLVVVRHGKGSFVRSQQAGGDRPNEHRTADSGGERVWQAIADLRREVADLKRRLDQA